jgi:hypothetical protein
MFYNCNYTGFEPWTFFVLNKSFFSLTGSPDVWPGVWHSYKSFFFVTDTLDNYSEMFVSEEIFSLYAGKTWNLRYVLQS